MLIQELMEAVDIRVDDLKKVLASKIKQLPDDEKTQRALQEIEDLLDHLNIGGRVALVSQALSDIGDADVEKTKKIIARYILSLDMAPKQRSELFALWKSDRLLNTKKLLDGRQNLSDLVTNYDQPHIQELVKDLMSVSALGHGKGEFGLTVLSKKITSPPSGKGDLLINGKKVEVKTTDGGAGRFTDQEVRPGAGFEQAARDLNAYMAKLLGDKIPKTGVNLTKVQALLPSLKPDQKQQLIAMTEKVVRLIFGGGKAVAGKQDVAAKLKNDIADFMKALKSDRWGEAKQAYARANFNYYMSMKEDDGVLYINLTKDPITLVYFSSAEELEDNNLRMHSKSIYLTSIADPRSTYPQILVKDIEPSAPAAGGKKPAAKTATKTSTATQQKAPVTPATTGKKITARQAPVGKVTDRGKR